MELTYLDHAATTPLARSVREAMAPYLDQSFGNPSSRHPAGVDAARAVGRARSRVARALAVEPRHVVFTSGGTEALNLAVIGAARAARSKGRRIVIGPTEHACVRGAAEALEREGFELVRMKLDARGDLDLADAASQLTADTVLVAQMYANNEFGTVYPIARLAALVRKLAPRARIVVDAVQACGKLDCAPHELGVDAVAISAHKLHGPKGVGALALASEFPIEPLLHGGGQEHGLRSGTENVAGCVGFGEALELAERERESAMARWTQLRATLTERLGAAFGARVLEPGARRLPSILALVWPGAPAEVRMHHLERHGVFVSAGSACQANKRELSPALRALGMSDDDIRSTLRISFGRTTTPQDVERAAQALEQVQRELEQVAR